ncbi:hypothetical protein LPJ66_003825 [Kickxella alabastrina]|uniref:Uncharacterized protein n=1 Tax=Kickxella alabastrina TaxID=61397 RepID=A0ACC1IJQ5_9FUNG|nr:hypothetical protein LPJ66_003825 [Kickxella alabastrina]
MPSIKGNSNKARSKQTQRQPHPHLHPQPQSQLPAESIDEQDVTLNQMISLIVSPIPRLERERHPRLTKMDYEGIVTRCQQLERRVFPKAEAMDLGKELHKPNQFLFVVLKFQHAALSTATSPCFQLVAYGVLALSRIDCTARISKMCTDPCFRRQGAGRLLLCSMLAALGSNQVPDPAILSLFFHPGSGFQMNVHTAQLHVDSDRHDAVGLYSQCGFVTKAEIRDYYSVGRDALLMTAAVSPTSEHE